MTISFLFSFNWTGDGLIFTDESANVFDCQLRVGMHDAGASSANAAGGSSVGSGSGGGSSGGSAGFGGMIAALPTLSNTLPGGTIPLPEMRHGAAISGHVSHSGGHARAGRARQPPKVKPPKPPHRYPHQIGHAPLAHRHHLHVGRDNGPIEAVAKPGTCSITLDNSTQRYSPDYTGSALFGNLLPRRAMRVQATDGVTTWTLFSGYVDRITPEAGLYSDRHVTLECVDAIELLAFQKVSLPLQINQRADQLISALVAATYTPLTTHYRTGSNIFDVSADQWTADRTAALDAIRECAESEFGRFFIQTDGTPTFLDRRFFFGAISTALTLDDSSPVELTVQRDVEYVFNVIKVVAHPRATLSTLGALAQLSSPLLIPPLGPSGAGIRIVTLHFRDAAGNGIGATGLIVPLVASTDYTINEAKDGSKVDYTSAPSFTLSVIDVRASEITVQLNNSALGALYATKLQVRGQAITTYDPVTDTQQDSTSQLAYQKRTWTHDLPLSADVDFAEALARYLLDRYKQPFTRITAITVHNDAQINGVNVFSLKLFDTLRVSDLQTGIAGMVCQIIGLDLRITPDGFHLTWLTERVDDHAYWALGVTGYGELDTHTRLAV